MFKQKNVYAMVKGFGVRLKDEREQDRNHLVEVAFEVPLDHDLADEILPAMAKDLFIVVAGELKPKPEMQEAVFNLNPHPQLMVIKTHPDMPEDARIAGTTLRRIKAVKIEGGTWALNFTATWSLGDPKEAILMIQRLKLGVYLTLEEQQPALPVDQVDGEVVDGEKTAEQPGLTLAKGNQGKGGRKKKGAGKTDGEAAAAQPAEAQQKELPPAPAGTTDEPAAPGPDSADDIPGDDNGTIN